MSVRFPVAGRGAVRRRFEVVPKRPYSLALTAERYTRFPEVVDRYRDGVYRRLVPLGRRTVLVSVAQAGPASRAVLDVQVEGEGAESPEAIRAAERIVHGSLGASIDVAAFYRAHAEDPVLGSPIAAFRGLRPAGVPSLWEALVTAVLAQQVNLRFAYDIRRELALAYGRRRRFEGETYVAFPGPEPLAGETLPRLRRFRLSRAKAVAIRGLARELVAGSLDEAGIGGLSDEDAILRLTRLPGFGRWTAEIGLMRGLARTDIFPAGDLGVVKYLARGLLGHATTAKEADMRRFASRWAPHRSLALVYAYAELNRRKAESLRMSAPSSSSRRSVPESAPSRKR